MERVTSGCLHFTTSLVLYKQKVSMVLTRYLLKNVIEWVQQL